MSKTNLQRNFWGHYNNRQDNTLRFPTGSRQDALRPELDSDRETIWRFRLDFTGLSFYLEIGKKIGKRVVACFFRSKK